MSDAKWELTPIEKVDGIYLKRNDKYEIAGCNGGKTISAYQILLDAKAQGYTDVITTGSRFSPQCEIVSCLSELLGLNAHIVMPSGQETKVMKTVKSNPHSELLTPYKSGGYQSTLNAYCRKLADTKGYYLVPFGMQCIKNVHLIAKQCENIPKEIKRIVVPVGSGMSFCGVLQGLVDFHRTDIEVIGVQAGGHPEKIIQSFKPKFVVLPKYELKVFMPDATPSERYHTVTDNYIGDLKLDPIYEGKCKDFIQEGDLFWVVGYHDI